MTAAQTEALLKITGIMREHFAAAICIVEGESSNLNAESLTYSTSGTWSSSLGLVVYAKDKLLKTE